MDIACLQYIGIHKHEIEVFVLIAMKTVQFTVHVNLFIAGCNKLG